MTATVSSEPYGALRARQEMPSSPQPGYYSLTQIVRQARQIHEHMQGVNMPVDQHLEVSRECFTEIERITTLLKRMERVKAWNHEKLRLMAYDRLNRLYQRNSTLRDRMKKAIDFIHARLNNIYNGCAIATSSTTVPMRNVIESLVAMNRQRGYVYNPNETSIRIVTDRIVLEEVDFGPFSVKLKFKSLKDTLAGSFLIQAIEPNERNGFYHPHVDSGTPCLGEDAPSMIRTALDRGDIDDALLLVVNVLKTYNRHSPYVAIERWQNMICSDCDSVIDENEDSHTCESSGDLLCDECARWVESREAYYRGRYVRWSESQNEYIMRDDALRCPRCDGYVDEDHWDSGRDICTSCVEHEEDEAEHNDEDSDSETVIVAVDPSQPANQARRCPSCGNSNFTTATQTVCDTCEDHDLRDRSPLAPNEPFALDAVAYANTLTTPVGSGPRATEYYEYKRRRGWDGVSLPDWIEQNIIDIVYHGRTAVSGERGQIAATFPTSSNRGNDIARLIRRLRIINATPLEWLDAANRIGASRDEYIAIFEALVPTHERFDVAHITVDVSSPISDITTNNRPLSQWGWGLLRWAIGTDQHLPEPIAEEIRMLRQRFNEIYLNRHPNLTHTASPTLTPSRQEEPF